MSFIAAHIHPVARLGGEYVKNAWTIAEKKFGGGEWVLGQLLDCRHPPVPALLAHGEPPQSRDRLSPDGWADGAHDGAARVKKTLEAEAALGYDLPA